MDDYDGNLLLGKLPFSVLIEGSKYDINADYRVMLHFEQLISAKDLTKEQKVLRALELFYPIIPLNTVAAMDELIKFYKRGKPDIAKHRDGTGEGSGKQIYSYEHDDGYIYAAFISTYRVDICDIPFLHWYKFRAMLESLTDDCLFVQIMGYRSKKIDQKMSKSERAFYQAKKRAYALPDNRTVEQKENDFAGMLLRL